MALCEDYHLRTNALCNLHMQVSHNHVTTWLCMQDTRINGRLLAYHYA